MSRPFSIRRALAVLVTACLVIGLGSPVSAQDELPADAPSAESLQARIDALAGVESLDKDELLGLYTKALQQLEVVRAQDQRAAEFERQMAEAPALLKSLQDYLAGAPLRDEPPMAPDVSLRDLEQQQLQAEANRAAAQKLVDELSFEAQHRVDRQGLLAGELARVGAAIVERETALRTTGANDAIGAARQALLMTELVALRAEERALTAERKTYEARRELLPLRRDRAQRELTRADQLAQLWQQRATARRRAEADAAAQEAEKQRRRTAARFPALSEIASRNEELASVRSGDEGVPAQMGRASADLLAAQQLRDELARRYASTRRKVAVGGLSEGIGQLLRREYEWTRKPADLRVESELRADELSRAQLLQISIQEDREAVGDVAVHAETIVGTLEPADSSTSVEIIETLARDLLTTQRSLQDSLDEELGKLINSLIEHDRVADELAETNSEYREYIEERILWVPSSEGSAIPDLGGALAGLRWLVSPGEWGRALDRSLDTVVALPGRCLFMLLVIVGLVLTRRRTRRALLATSELSRSYRTDAYGLTLRALAATVGLALPLPLIVWSVGWLLQAPTYQVDVARVVGSSLQQASITFLVLGFVYQTTKKNHVGEAHFRWPTTTTVPLRNALRWFMPTALPLEFLALVFHKQGSLEWSDSVGRIAFIAFITSLTVVLFRLFRSSGPTLAQYFQKSNSLLERTHRLWFGLLMAAPLSLLVLACCGYYYTALAFEDKMRETLRLGVGLIFINSLLLRWLFIARRRLATEQARARVQAKAAAPAEQESAPSRESGSTPFDEESIDIPAVDAQTRQLIRSGILTASIIGLYFIWAGTFPALHALDRVQLWPSVAVLEDEDSLSHVAPPSLPESNGSSAGSNESSQATEGASLPIPDANFLPTGAAPQAEPGITITVADLVLALVILILTTVAMKNAPGVLEISILQRLPMDSGSRFALSTLFRYLILILGLTAGFGALGIGWNKIQWLAAALTFGLAFGLQEIVANFVSGIIILIERPIRVGDIVTVAGTEGRVTRLRMRATTILDWDRREMLVPNKEFITGSVINWTLSDPTTRMTLAVGIAYGSDTKRARELLMQVASENPLVMEDPKPSAIFRGFGESSLDFQLRVFMSNRDLWPQLIDRLHTEIDDAFRAENIEISFPQRDLHLRSAEGVVQIRDDGAVRDQSPLG